ncbi:TPA: SDR family NAD(P)-dependent oxidoreductase [Pseudomonas aeruginosa]
MNEQIGNGVALVTGASSGIGATYAEHLARRGHDLLLVARDRQRLEALADRLRQAHGVRVELLRADLSERDDRLRVERRLRDDASIALLVNNAGVAMNGPLADADMDRAERMIALNVVALTRLAAGAAEGFRRRGGGAIVNLGSVVALAPELFNAVYSATKAYVLSLSQSLQHELAGSGVYVQAVLPGVTRTEIWERSGAGIAGIPAEMVMEVEDLVEAALVGFDRREAVTIPSLPDAADWQALMTARARLAPNLSRQRPAERYLG